MKKNKTILKAQRAYNRRTKKGQPVISKMLTLSDDCLRILLKRFLEIDILLSNGMFEEIDNSLIIRDTNSITFMFDNKNIIINRWCTQYNDKHINLLLCYSDKYKIFRKLIKNLERVRG